MLRVLSQHAEGLSLAEICRRSEVSKPTGHRLLGVLGEAGMVREFGRGVYGLGPQCLVLGSAFLDGLDLRREAKGVLEDLVSKTGETCHLGIRDGDRIVYIEKLDSPKLVQLKTRVGLTNPLHSTALGKVLLAYDGEADIEAMFARGVERRTPNTITDVEVFRAELEEVRERGFAVDDVENEEGIRCVAAPVFDHGGAAVASISVSSPEYRVSRERLQEIGALTREAALVLSRRMGYRHGANEIGEEARKDIV